MLKLILMMILSVPAVTLAEESGRLRNFKKVREPLASEIYQKASALIMNSRLECKTAKRGSISPVEFGDHLFKTLEVYEGPAFAGSRRFILYNRNGAYDTSYELHTGRDQTVLNRVYFVHEVYQGDPQNPTTIDIGHCQ